MPGASINRVLGEIRLPNGGHVDFWSVDHTQRAGRGRKYHLVLIDEAAHDEGYLTDAFPAAIAPTLLDYAGSIVEASTPNGVSPDNHFWQAAHLAELGFVMHHAPTSANPHLPPEEIRALRATMRPEIASQELDALFVSLEGMSIFPLLPVASASGRAGLIYRSQSIRTEKRHLVTAPPRIALLNRDTPMRVHPRAEPGGGRRANAEFALRRSLIVARKHGVDRAKDQGL